jgi:hypothetical protein
VPGGHGTLRVEAPRAPVRKRDAQNQAGSDSRGQYSHAPRNGASHIGLLHAAMRERDSSGDGNHRGERRRVTAILADQLMDLEGRHGSRECYGSPRRDVRQHVGAGAASRFL